MWFYYFMSRLIVGSIEVTKLLEAMKKGHSAFKRAKNDKDRIFAAITIWENDEPDDNGNNFAIQLNSTKEKRGEEKKVYIGNAKSLEKGGATETEDMSSDDTKGVADKISSAIDDLPF